MGEKFYSVTANEYSWFLADGTVQEEGPSYLPQEELGDFDTLDEAVAVRDAWIRDHPATFTDRMWSSGVTFYEALITMFYTTPDDPDDPDNPDELHAERLEEYTVSALTGTPEQEKWRECVKRYGYR